MSSLRQARTFSEGARGACLKLPVCVQMLDFCAEKNITSMVEVVNAQDVNESMKKMEAGKVKYRFVIDVQASMIAEE
jgi:D-arabinose 1-dehydrogenase-like Zn-dependent alcohol dehydrogenase